MPIDCQLWWSITRWVLFPANVSHEGVSGIASWEGNGCLGDAAPVGCLERASAASCIMYHDHVYHVYVSCEICTGVSSPDCVVGHSRSCLGTGP